ncbi:unnamed protein product [Arctogadus glacialis]
MANMFLNVPTPANVTLSFASPGYRVIRPPSPVPCVVWRVQPGSPGWSSYRNTSVSATAAGRGITLARERRRLPVCFQIEAESHTPRHRCCLKDASTGGNLPLLQQKKGVILKAFLHDGGCISLECRILMQNQGLLPTSGILSPEAEQRGSRCTADSRERGSSKQYKLNRGLEKYDN